MLTPKKPDFFLVGAAKCGTTAMYSYLGQHPEIFIPDTSETVETVLGGKKELHFFGKDLKFSRPTLEEYYGYFSQAKTEKRLGESSVFYLYSVQAASEIKQFAPDASIIVMLRNPIDVMYAWHSQLVFWGDEDITDFGEAIARESDRAQGLKIPRQHDHPIECFFYGRLVQFSEQLQRYWDLFGKEKVKVIIFDDFQSNTAQVYREVLEFLGVDPNFLPELQIVNQNKAIRNPHLQKLIRRPPASVKTLVKTIFPYSLRQSLRTAILRRNIQQKTRTTMNPELRQLLQEKLTPEVETLSQMLGRDLTHWVNQQLTINN